jgi:phospho-N-acetylmuramoyl-pentapeptide-transferase
MFKILRADLREIVTDPETGRQKMQYVTEDVKSTKTTIPFVKKNEFDYAWLVAFAGDAASWLKWVVYALAIILIITAVSNAANLLMVSMDWLQALRQSAAPRWVFWPM